VDNLVQVAGTGKGALGPAVGQVGQTCGACHKAYRAENF
ncbi:MAG: cytochrome c, partial [Pseudomonadota bacterium]